MGPIGLTRYNFIDQSPLTTDVQKETKMSSKIGIAT